MTRNFAALVRTNWRFFLLLDNTKKDIISRGQFPRGAQNPLDEVPRTLLYTGGGKTAARVPI